MTGAPRLLIVTYDHRPCPVEPAPLSVTWAIYLPLTPMQASAPRFVRGWEV